MVVGACVLAARAHVLRACVVVAVSARHTQHNPPAHTRARAHACVRNTAGAAALVARLNNDKAQRQHTFGPFLACLSGLALPPS